VCWPTSALFAHGVATDVAERESLGQR